MIAVINIEHANAIFQFFPGANGLVNNAPSEVTRRKITIRGKNPLSSKCPYNMTQAENQIARVITTDHINIPSLDQFFW